jgi:hypothetical protein
LTINELDIKSDLVAGSTDAPFQDISDTQIGGDLLHVRRFSLVGKGGSARDDEGVSYAREVGDQVLGEGVGEIVLVGIVREVVEG